MWVVVLLVAAGAGAAFVAGRGQSAQPPSGAPAAGLPVEPATRPERAPKTEKWHKETVDREVKRVAGDDPKLAAEVRHAIESDPGVQADKAALEDAERQNDELLRSVAREQVLKKIGPAAAGRVSAEAFEAMVRAELPGVQGYFDYMSNVIEIAKKMAPDATEAQLKGAVQAALARSSVTPDTFRLKVMTPEKAAAGFERDPYASVLRGALRAQGVDVR